jgi:O-antigen/teichoic acid export membrane protein
MSLFTRSFFKDLASTYASEIAVVLASVAAPAIVTRLTSLEDLGVYLVLRRIALATAYPLSLGLAPALARQLPLLGGEKTVQARWSVLAIVTSLGFTILCMLSIFLWPVQMARWILGDSHLVNFIRPMVLLVIASVIQAVAFGALRGMFRIQSGNVLQALTTGAIPVFSLVWLRKLGLAGCIELTSSLMLVISILFMLPVFTASLRSLGQASSHWMKRASKSLLGYGLSRVPSTALAGLLFALGPLQIAHKSGYAEVAILALGLNFLRLGEASIAPFGVVILPRLSLHVNDGSVHQAMKDFSLLLATLMPMALFVSFQTAILHQTILTLWLGRSSPSSGLLFVPMVFALPFYMAYELLRHAIDAASAVPYNTVAIAIAVAVLAVGGWIPSVFGTVAVQMTAFILLGLLSGVVWAWLYRIRKTAFPYFTGAFAVSIVSGIWTWFLFTHISQKLPVLALNEIILFLALTALTLHCVRIANRASSLAESPADSQP